MPGNYYQITLRTRAFGGVLETNRHRMQDGEDQILPYGPAHVAVWDDVAGHWTTCHSLSAQDAGRIRAAIMRDRAQRVG